MFEIMFELLKLYPNQMGFFVGIGIGLGTYIISTSLCIFASGCNDGNPFFPLVAFLGSGIVGMYCSWLVKGKIKFFVGFVVTFLTIFVFLGSGMRGVLDNLVGGESVVSHSSFYGLVTLAYTFTINLLKNSQASK
jgi:hypothetical protein